MPSEASQVKKQPHRHPYFSLQVKNQRRRWQTLDWPARRQGSGGGYRTIAESCSPPRLSFLEPIALLLNLPTDKLPSDVALVPVSVSQRPATGSSPPTRRPAERKSWPGWSIIVCFGQLIYGLCNAYSAGGPKPPHPRDSARCPWPGRWQSHTGARDPFRALP